MPRARNAIRRRTPKQDRSRRLVEAILEAARLLLAESGADALTTVNVAQRAGVSVGSLYQYFAGRDALLFALCEAEVSGFQEAWRAFRANPLGGRDGARVREGVGLVLAHYRRLAAIEPAFFLAHREEIARSLRPPRARASARDASRAKSEATRERSSTTRAAERDAEVARFMLAHGIPSLLDAALAHAPAMLDEPTFERELIALVRGCLSRASG